MHPAWIARSSHGRDRQHATPKRRSTYASCGWSDSGSGLSKTRASPDAEQDTERRKGFVAAKRRPMGNHLSRTRVTSSRPSHTAARLKSSPWRAALSPTAENTWGRHTMVSAPTGRVTLAICLNRTCVVWGLEAHAIKALVVCGNPCRGNLAGGASVTQAGQESYREGPVVAPAIPLRTSRSCENERGCFSRQSESNIRRITVGISRHCFIF
jgi:hypothetical protein